MYKKTLVDIKYGGVNMFIGGIIEDMMKSLGINKI